MCLSSTLRLSADETIAYVAIQFSIDAHNLQPELNKIAVGEVKLKMVFNGIYVLLEIKIRSYLATPCMVIYSSH
jgi:hypothetical protein